MTDKYGTTRIRVRYADTDQMGVAYNGMYLTWFEVGRTELMRAAGVTYRDIEQRGIFLPVVEAGVKYLKPARYDNVILVNTSIEMQRGARIRFHYEVEHEHETLAEGFTEHVFTDTDMKPLRPPRDLKNMKRFLSAQATPDTGKESHND